MKPRVRTATELVDQRTDADWGSLSWITESGVSPAGLTVGRVTIKAGQSNPEHLHTTCDEILYLLAGRLRHSFGSKEVVLNAGDSIEIPRDTPHRAWSIGDEDADMIVVYNSAERDFKATSIADLLVGSPMCFPADDLETVFKRFSRIGLTKIEAFTRGPASALNLESSPEGYRSRAAKHGLSFHSMHLPVIRADDPSTLTAALDALGFARRIGVSIAIYKATSINEYIRCARQMLDRAEVEGMTLVLQNHGGSVIATDDDVATILEGAADDRLAVLLEVGHYEKLGIPWRVPFKRFRDRISYCHVKDMRGSVSVPFGTGDVELHGLFHEMGEIEYGNGYVLELEARDLQDDPGVMVQALADSIAALEQVIRG